MSFHKLYLAGALMAAALVSVPQADASPRFTVKNKTDTKINVYIFKGDDSFCSLEEKMKTASAGETDTYGCSGAGKGQCKVLLKVNGYELCKDSRNTCSKNAIKVPDGATLKISQEDDKASCDVIE